MNATAVIDTADILLAQPIAVRPGESIDFSGTALSVDFTPIRGGPVVMSASTADGTLAFVGGASPHFVIDLPVAGRTWRVERPTAVRGDILRRPDPANPGRVEWLGRTELLVLPGSSSSAIALAAQSPVLLDAQPYDGRIVTAPMVVGLQGAPGPQGPPGTGGGSGSGAAIFSQTTPSASWAIPHAFGRFPSVSVYDATGAELLADIAATPTTVSVVFATPTAGTAILT